MRDKQGESKIKCTNNKSISKSYNGIIRNVRTTRKKLLMTNDFQQMDIDKAVTSSSPSPHLINLSSGHCDSFQGLHWPEPGVVQESPSPAEELIVRRIVTGTPSTSAESVYAL